MSRSKRSPAGNPGSPPRAQTLVHPIAPVFDARSQVLVLGSFPSPKSREEGFFYGNPRNRFWQVLARLFDEPVATTVERKRDQLLRHRIALWDVLASCTIEGASDASIRDAQPNDLGEIFETADIRAVFCAGTTAGRLYRRHCARAVGRDCVVLPSTSPANAAMGLDDLVEAWGALPQAIDHEYPPALDVADVVALEQSIAADVPSGLDAQTGQAATPCIEASETLAMLCFKPGQLQGQGPALCGDVRLAPLCDISAYVELEALWYTAGHPERPQGQAGSA